jgi:hypothetical protein
MGFKLWLRGVIRGVGALPRRKAEAGEVRRLAEEVFQGEAGEQYLTAINELAKKLGKEPREVFQSALQVGLKAYEWGRMTIPDLIVCVDVLGYLDEKFYKRIYVESPIDSVIRQADKFSEATRKILEGYAKGIETLAVRKAEAQKGEEEARREEARRQPSQGVIDKAIDIIMGYVAEELGARVSKEIADVAAPGIKEALLRMIKEGRVRIELAGEEVVVE